MARPQFYIADGVRRSVAAREAGLAEVLARIVEPGKPDILTRTPLDQLHSPKPSIIRDGRYIRVEAATKAGKQLTPIEVQPLGQPGQRSTVEIAQVQLR